MSRQCAYSQWKGSLVLGGSFLNAGPLHSTLSAAPMTQMRLNEEREILLRSKQGLIRRIDDRIAGGGIRIVGTRIDRFIGIKGFRIPSRLIGIDGTGRVLNGAVRGRATIGSGAIWFVRPAWTIRFFLQTIFWHEDESGLGYRGWDTGSHDKRTDPSPTFSKQECYQRFSWPRISPFL